MEARAPIGSLPFPPVGFAGAGDLASRLKDGFGDFPNLEKSPAWGLFETTEASRASLSVSVEDGERFGAVLINGAGR